MVIRLPLSSRCSISNRLSTAPRPLDEGDAGRVEVFAEQIGDLVRERAEPVEVDVGDR
jgi:hypothetical protein